MINDINFSKEITDKLNSFFIDGRSPHAVLIDGGTVEERSALARLTAKMIVCSQQDMTPCGMFPVGDSPNVFEMPFLTAGEAVKEKTAAIRLPSQCAG